MAEKIIAIDADDTLFDENTAIRLFMNETYGYTHTAEDYQVDAPYDGNWDQLWQVDDATAADMFQAFLQSDHKRDLQPIPGAQEALQKLKQNYDLVIVIPRDAQMVELTHVALDQHFPNIFSDVHFVPLWGNGEKVSKAEICTEIGAKALVDDCFEHCELAAGTGVPALLFGDYGRNRYQVAPSGVTRCPDWQSVLAHIDKL